MKLWLDPSEAGEQVLTDDHTTERITAKIATSPDHICVRGRDDTGGQGQQSDEIARDEGGEGPQEAVDGERQHCAETFRPYAPQAVQTDETGEHVHDPGEHRAVIILVATHEQAPNDHDEQTYGEEGEQHSKRHVPQIGAGGGARIA